MKLSQFQALAALNVHGLVAMRVIVPFAPYAEGEVAGFPPDDAHHLFATNVAQPLDIIEVGDDDDGAQVISVIGAVAIEIPADWQGLHHLKRVKLAGELAGRKIANKEEADEVIAAEVAKRAAAPEQG